MADNATAEFYDEFWPKNVPHYEETKKYMLATLSGRKYARALDAGCGHGLCAVVLSELADEVVAIDISPSCITTARQQANHRQRSNVRFSVQDLQKLSEPSQHFDLVWCWGVAMMAPEPMKVIHQLFRVTQPGGELYLSLYLKTWLSPVHELVRHFCRAFMNTPRRKKWVLLGFTKLTLAIVALRGSQTNARADNVSIQAQVDDWYYPPHKTFYSIEEIIALCEANGFEAQCIQDRVGRMRSATIFVIKAVKRPLRR
ncbi:MAG TPA: class I SAM-dependent methyltransferase [Opitutaceae bacterium]|nr:class I SAM-dependent methyltransferase [Opitutaceae bacterium]